MRWWYCFFGAGLLLGCESAPTSAEPVPAQLATIDDLTEAELAQAVSALIGRRQISFGPGLEVGATGFTVLPPRLTPAQGNSPAVPERFEILIQGDVCLIRNTKTGAQSEVPGLDCINQH